MIFLVTCMHDNFDYTTVSGFENNVVLLDSPIGGCGVLLCLDIASKVSIVNTAGKHLPCIHVENDYWKLLVICVYLRHEDSRSNNDVYADKCKKT